MANASTTPEDFQGYRQGCKGAGVELIQAALKELGYLSSDAVTGTFCATTEKAVMDFQGARQLEANGAVGRETWEKLFPTGGDGAFSFNEVLEQELRDIALSRRMRLGQSGVPGGDSGIFTRCHDSRLLGLAFSGGGIRSATFNLGVLQALAEFKLLRRIDYLSTVSGGGYIGGWLTAWVHRQGQSMRKVENSLAQDSSDLDPGKGPSPHSPAGDGERAPIRFLRSFSNYITPKTGIFSADTWCVVSTYTRNLVLNLTIIITGFICLLLGPRLLVQGFYDYVWDYEHAVILSPWKILVPTLLLLAVCAGFIAWNLDELERHSPASTWPANAKQPMVQAFIVLPALIAAVLLANLLGHGPGLGENDSSWWWALAGSAIYLGLWILGWAVSRRLDILPGGAADAGPAGKPGAARGPAAPRVAKLNKRLVFSILVWAGLVGAGGGLLLQGLKYLFAYWKEGTYFAQYLAAFMTWGPPLIILLISFVVTLHIGLLGRRFSEKQQEWWSRLGGWLLIVALGWSLLFGLAVYGPWMSDWILRNDWSKYGLTSGWLLATVAGVFAGKSPSTGTPGSDTRLELIAKVAPYLFAIGLFLALSHLTNDVLDCVIRYTPRADTVLQFADDQYDRITRYFIVLVWREKSGPTLALLISCAFLSALFGWRVDINRFSMHLLYRNRLTRCYLGASNGDRKQQPFTGFDPGDDLALHELTPTRWPAGKDPYRGPYLISNTALNLVAGEELAWQQRKAASFVLTPRFCGYELPHRGGRCFRTTKAFAADDGGISLGTAMAISGAAVSPNMGYHSSPPLAFLLTVFNIRLGWWLGNPRGAGDAASGASSCPLREQVRRAMTPTWKRAGPRFALRCLAAELFGLTGENSPYMYLSDGGHFDNLGIYELVRRRCRYIISCDAGQDPNLECDDLGNAIRKVYDDLGIEIEIDVDPIRTREKGKLSRRHCAVGTVHYEKVDRGAAPGTLIYLKASLTGDEPTDLLSYKAREAEFPHRSTADQWFDESQFESYRKLGRHIAEKTFGMSVATVVERQKRRIATLPGGATGPQASDDDVASVPDAEALFHALRQTWYPPSSAVEASFSKHGKTLEEIFERLRKDENLKFLDIQIYPEWKKLTPAPEPAGKARLLLPESPDELRAGFYLCNSMIQLMENVYLDLRLEQEYDHPDTRGWMNLFMHWAWSSMFRATWAVCACTYGARFQVFCGRRLGLTIGEVEVRPLDPRRGDHCLPLPELACEAVENQCLNFLEAELIADFCRENVSLRDDLTLWIMEIVVRDSGWAPEDGGGEYFIGLRFTFGFALVDAQHHIAYFRVQDHLRTMGLARKGMKMMIQHARDAGLQLGLDLRSMPATAREVPDAKDLEQLEQIYKSVYYELHGAAGHPAS